MYSEEQLKKYRGAIIMVTHDRYFLESITHRIAEVDRGKVYEYDGNYNVYLEQKAQREAAYNRQQQEIAELKDFVARNKARVATRNMAMSRQKKLDNMDIIEKIYDKPKPEFHFKVAKTPGKILFETQDSHYIV